MALPFHIQREMSVLRGVGYHKATIIKAVRNIFTLNNAPDQEASAANNPQTTSSEHEWDCTPGSFIGQGRKIGYNGLAYAVISAIADAKDHDPQRLADPRSSSYTPSFVRGYERRPPTEWRACASIALWIVLIEIGMAVMMSSTVPTIGVGCRSGLYIIYFLLSTCIWFLHLFSCFRRQGFWAKVLTSKWALSL